VNINGGAIGIRRKPEDLRLIDGNVTIPCPPNGSTVLRAQDRRVIIRPDRGAHVYITQPDHARLAEALLTQWRADDFPNHPRRASLMLAAREHDNGWRELDEELVFDPEKGRVLDFMAVPDDVKQSVWPRSVERVKDPFAAALIAKHATYVYNAHRGKPAWAPFFADMERRRDLCLEASGVSLRDLEADYRFLAVVDLLSLSFCNGWGDAQDRFDCHVRWESGVLRIRPALLGSHPVPVRIRARRLEDGKYASAAEARAAFETAPVEMIEGIALGSA
jgi:hypothetical protein